MVQLRQFLSKTSFHVRCLYMVGFIIIIIQMWTWLNLKNIPRIFEVTEWLSLLTRSCQSNWVPFYAFESSNHTDPQENIQIPIVRLLKGVITRLCQKGKTRQASGKSHWHHSWTFACERAGRLLIMPQRKAYAQIKPSSPNSFQGSKLCKGWNGLTQR